MQCKRPDEAPSRDPPEPVSVYSRTGLCQRGNALRLRATNYNDFGDSHQIGQRLGTQFLRNVRNFGCYLVVHESGGRETDRPCAGDVDRRSDADLGSDGAVERCCAPHTQLPLTAPPVPRRRQSPMYVPAAATPMKARRLE
jgi:hypothetical protein